MGAADWTTQFRGEDAMDTDRPSDGPARPSGAAAPADSTFVGSRVGAYLITKWLGAGGVGEVFKAVDVMLKREVAIKVLRQELACDPLFLERFRRDVLITRNANKNPAHWITSNSLSQSGSSLPSATHTCARSMFFSLML